MQSRKQVVKKWVMKTCVGHELIPILEGMEGAGWHIFTVTGNGVMEQQPNPRQLITNSGQQKPQTVGLYTVVAWKEKR